MELSNKRFESACSVLTQEISTVLMKTKGEFEYTAQEIILRTNRPVCIECADKRYYFTQNGCATNKLLDQPMLKASKRTLFSVFQNICNYSVYSRQNQINNGFITLKGGHRAGICGTAVINEEKISNIKDISSISIRISREIKNCSDEIVKKINVNKGVLVCGSPKSGKTTIIRDLARKLSYDYKVSVIDERNELSSTVNGVAQNDMGMCDIYENYPKRDAITQAVRSMAPDIIICDELGEERDIDAVMKGVNSGVAFIATMHCDDIKSLKLKRLAKKLLLSSAFSQIVFLDNKENVGKCKAVYSLSDICLS